MMLRTAATSVGLLLQFASAQPPADPPKPEPVYKFYSTVFGTSVIKAGGLTGLVYEIDSETKQLPLFSHMRPVSKIWTTKLNIPLQDFSVGFPGVPERFEWFAIDYTGKIWISKPGKYRFRLASDDGSALFIDNRVVVNNDGIHPIETRKGRVHMAAGVHEIRIAYFQGPRFQLALTLEVAGPGQKFQVFDMEQFAPPPAH